MTATPENRCPSCRAGRAGCGLAAVPSPLVAQILDAAFEPDPTRIEVHMQVMTFDDHL